jgi:hypothetical protein
MREADMAKQQGIEKQVPLDQRGRGKNLEHPEGQANEENQRRQAGGAAPVPKPKPKAGS